VRACVRACVCECVRMCALDRGCHRKRGGGKALPQTKNQTRRATAGAAAAAAICRTTAVQTRRGAAGATEQPVQRQSSRSSGPTESVHPRGRERRPLWRRRAGRAEREGSLRGELAERREGGAVGARRQVQVGVRHRRRGGGDGGRPGQRERGARGARVKVALRVNLDLALQPQLLLLRRNADLVLARDLLSKQRVISGNLG